MDEEDLQDFYSLKRKDLQALCKKHKIRANLSNLEMANKLTQLFKGKEKVVVEKVDVVGEVGFGTSLNEGKRSKTSDGLNGGEVVGSGDLQSGNGVGLGEKVLTEMELRGMKRKELQGLCKKHSVPANLKNEEMVKRLTKLFEEQQKPSSDELLIENVSVYEEIDDVVVSKKAKKVKFSPEHEVIEFTRLRQTGRGRRSSVVSRNSTLSVNSVNGAELCGENVSRIGRKGKKGASDVKEIVEEKVVGEPQLLLRRSSRRRNAIENSEVDAGCLQVDSGVSVAKIDSGEKLETVPQNQEIGKVEPVRSRRKSVFPSQGQTSKYEHESKKQKNERVSKRKVPVMRDDTSSDNLPIDQEVLTIVTKSSKEMQDTMVNISKSVDGCLQVDMEGGRGKVESSGELDAAFNNLESMKDVPQRTRRKSVLTLHEESRNSELKSKNQPKEVAGKRKLDVLTEDTAVDDSSCNTLPNNMAHGKTSGIVIAAPAAIYDTDETKLSSMLVESKFSDALQGVPECSVSVPEVAGSIIQADLSRNAILERSIDISEGNKYTLQESLTYCGTEISDMVIEKANADVASHAVSLTACAEVIQASDDFASIVFAKTSLSADVPSTFDDQGYSETDLHGKFVPVPENHDAVKPVCMDDKISTSDVVGVDTLNESEVRSVEKNDYTSLRNSYKSIDEAIVDDGYKTFNQADNISDADTHVAEVQVDSIELKIALGLKQPTPVKLMGELRNDKAVNSNIAEATEGGCLEDFNGSAGVREFCAEYSFNRDSNEVVVVHELSAAGEGSLKDHMGASHAENEVDLDAERSVTTVLSLSETIASDQCCTKDDADHKGLQAFAVATRDDDHLTESCKGLQADIVHSDMSEKKMSMDEIMRDEEIENFNGAAEILDIESPQNPDSGNKFEASISTSLNNAKCIMDNEDSYDAQSVNVEICKNSTISKAEVKGSSDQQSRNIKVSEVQVQEIVTCSTVTNVVVEPFGTEPCHYGQDIDSELRNHCATLADRDVTRSSPNHAPVDGVKLSKLRTSLGSSSSIRMCSFIGEKGLNMDGERDIELGKSLHRRSVLEATKLDLYEIDCITDLQNATSPVALTIDVEAKACSSTDIACNKEEIATSPKNNGSKSCSYNLCDDVVQHCEVALGKSVADSQRHTGPENNCYFTTLSKDTNIIKETFSDAVVVSSNVEITMDDARGGLDDEIEKENELQPLFEIPVKSNDSCMDDETSTHFESILKDVSCKEVFCPTWDSTVNESKLDDINGGSASDFEKFTDVQNLVMASVSQVSNPSPVAGKEGDSTSNDSCMDDETSTHSESILKDVSCKEVFCPILDSTVNESELDDINGGSASDFEKFTDVQNLASVSQVSYPSPVAGKEETSAGSGKTLKDKSCIEVFYTMEETIVTQNRSDNIEGGSGTHNGRTIHESSSFSFSNQEISNTASVEGDEENVLELLFGTPNKTESSYRVDQVSGSVTALEGKSCMENDVLTKQEISSEKEGEDINKSVGKAVASQEEGVIYGCGVARGVPRPEISEVAHDLCDEVNKNDLPCKDAFYTMENNMVNKSRSDDINRGTGGEFQAVDQGLLLGSTSANFTGYIDNEFLLSTPVKYDASCILDESCGSGSKLKDVTCQKAFSAMEGELANGSKFDDVIEGTGTDCDKLVNGSSVLASPVAGVEGTELQLLFATPYKTETSREVDVGVAQETKEISDEGIQGIHSMSEGRITSIGQTSRKSLQISDEKRSDELVGSDLSMNLSYGYGSALVDDISTMVETSGKNKGTEESSTVKIAMQQPLVVPQLDLNTLHSENDGILKESDVMDTIQEYIDSESYKSAAIDTSKASQLSSESSDNIDTAAVFSEPGANIKRLPDADIQEDLTCSEPVNQELQEASLSITDQGLAEDGLVASEENHVSENKLQRSSLTQFSTAKKKTRAILIHGTPRKPLVNSRDMKENAPMTKNSLPGDITTARPIKRRALQDI